MNSTPLRPPSLRCWSRAAVPGARALALAGVLAALAAIALLPQAVIKIAAEQKMLPLMGTSAVYWSFVTDSATSLLSARNRAKLRRAGSRVVRRVAVAVA